VTTHLYCLLPHDLRASIPPGLSGVNGALVRAIPVDRIIAWVSDVVYEVPNLTLFEGGSSPPPYWPAVQAHDAVVEAALETGATPAPARFGQRFDDDAACAAAIASRAASVESLLADIQGCVEMTLIVTPSTRRMIRDLEPVIPEIFEPEVRGAGRKYLETLRRREAVTGAVKEGIDEIARVLNDAVGGLVRRAAVHDSVTPLPLRTISHLIARRDAAQYKEAVSGVQAGREFRFLVIGPRAPYSFSGLSSSGGAHGMKLAD
jgi:hypothetical protein